MAQEIRIQTNGKKRHAGNLSFLFNGKRGKSMAKKKKNRSRKPNPFRSHRSTKRHSRRHGHNPFREKRMGGKGTVETVLGAAAGFIIPDLIEGMMPTFNSGFMGYIADAVIGGVIWWLGGATLGRGFADGALGGITAKISNRALQDMGTNPPNAIHANIRDAQANASNAAQPGPPANQPMQGIGKPSQWKSLIPAYQLQPGGATVSQNLSLGNYNGMAAVPQRPLRRRM